MGPKLCDFAKDVWSNNNLIKQVNKTLLVLIAKVNKPDFISQFRPISLCNVSYKCITKAIVNRIKSLLNEYVSPFQASFVPERNVHDNSIVAHEIIHTMSRMKGKRRFMSIKIDLEKAYDRLSWVYISRCLEEIKSSRPLWPILLWNVLHRHISLFFGMERSLKMFCLLEESVKVIHYLPIFLLYAWRNFLI